MNTKIIPVILIVLCVGLLANAENKNIDPKADELLHKMSDTLANVSSFSVSTSETHDRHKRSGKTGQLNFSRQIILQRPGGLWMHAVGVKGGEASVWYDGKLLTLQSDVEKVYASVEMPPTLDEAIDYAATNLDLPMPMADLFYSSPYDSLMSDDTQGSYVNTEKIEGKDCAQLAFQNAHVDWRIWIVEGEKTVPCRLEITYKEEPGQPKSIMTFRDWNFAPKIDAGQFTHKAPEDYEQIPVFGYAKTATEETKN